MSCCGKTKKKITKNNEEIKHIAVDNEKTKLKQEQRLLSRLRQIDRMVEQLSPYLMFNSERDIECLECCEKHLSKAYAYIEESKTSEYRSNRFKAIGQMGLAEAHVNNHPDFRELIRSKRLELQREGGINKFSDLIEALDLLQNDDNKK